MGNAPVQARTLGSPQSEGVYILKKCAIDVSGGSNKANMGCGAASRCVSALRASVTS